MKQVHDGFWLAFSVQVYQGLSFTLPPDFRRDHGRDMLQVFRDCCGHAYQCKGNIGIIGELITGTFDLLINAIRERSTEFLDDGKRIRALLAISLVAIGAGAYAASADLRNDELPGPIYMVVVFTFALAFLCPSSFWLTGLLVSLMLPVVHHVAQNKGWTISYPTNDSTSDWSLLNLVPAVLGSISGSILRIALNRILRQCE